MNDQKNSSILVLVNSHPPCKNIVAAQRWFYFKKYLPLYGIQVDLICQDEKRSDYATSKDREQCVYRVPSPVHITKPLNIAPLFWSFAVRNLCKKLIAKKHYKAVVLSGPPFFTMLNAPFFSKIKPDVPIILDFRDGWSTYPFFDRQPWPTQIAERLFFMRQEKKCVAVAQALMFPVEGLKKEYEALYPQKKETSYYIPNGYDDEAFTGYKPSQSTNKVFTIAYCGSLDRTRSPQPLLNAIKHCADIPIKLLVVGTHKNRWQAEVQKLGIAHILDHKGVLESKEMVQALSQAELLCIVQSYPKKSQELSAVSSRTYVYLRLGKPILYIGPPGDNQTVLERYATNAYYSSKMEIQDCIRVAYAEWKSNVPVPEYNPEVIRFSRQAIAGEFANQVLNKIAS